MKLFSFFSNYPRGALEGNSYFSEPTKGFVEENFKITKALAHKTSDEKSPKHQEFLENIKEKIAIQQAKVKHKIF